VREPGTVNGGEEEGVAMAGAYSQMDSPDDEEDLQELDDKKGDQVDEREEENAGDEKEEADGEAADKELLSQMMRKARKRTKHPITNADILYPKLEYIDEEGKFRPNTPTEEILSFVESREKSETPLVLVLVSPQDRIARVFSVKEYQAHLEKACDLAKANKVAIKSVQVTWNISDSDLEYRLKRGVEDLKRGHRLDIMLGARKAKLMRDWDERAAMLAHIRKTFEPYGYEWTKMSGGFPNAEMWFQGYTEEQKAKMEKMKVAASGAAASTAGTSAAVPGWADQENPAPRPWEVEDQQEDKAVAAREAHLKSIDKEYKKLFLERKDLAGGYWIPMAREGKVTAPETGSQLKQKKREKQKKDQEEKQAAREVKKEKAKKRDEEKLRPLEDEENEGRKKLMEKAAKISKSRKVQGILETARLKDVWGTYDPNMPKSTQAGGTY
jgi:translation initiation factor IF-3